MTNIGDPRGLHFNLHWIPTPGSRATDATQGELTAWVDDRLVWGAGEPSAPAGFSWSWVELLEHMTAAWLSLECEEINPIRLQADPGVLWTIAQRYWEDIPESQKAEEEEQVWAFLNAHDLARGLQGVAMPSLWVLREGKKMLIGTTDHKIRRPLDETLATLSLLGDGIAERLKSVTDERAAIAASAWSSRRDWKVADFLATSTGLPSSFLQDVSGKESLAATWEIDPKAPQTTELLAAARMMDRSLQPSEVRKIVHRVRKFKYRPTETLDGLAVEAEAYLASLALNSPHEQGHALAEWLRQQPKIADDKGRVEPERLLRHWGVSVQQTHLFSPRLDAMTCWGPKHGPGVLVNSKGKHAHSEHGRRATLAHEICHLLVDRHGALPLGEVLGGICPPLVESRASAFAAELLLPRKIAGKTLSSGAVKSQVRSLQNRYGVSQELVAWQGRASGAPLAPATFSHLRTLVSDPEHFGSRPPLLHDLGSAAFNPGRRGLRKKATKSRAVL